VFEEEVNSTISDDVFNSRWIRELVGPSGLKNMARRRIVCSGTTAGDKAGILHYLHAMEREIVWRRQPMGSHDQGVHNLLTHGPLAPFVTMQRNGAGRVFTAGRVAELPLNGQGVIVNDDGSTVPVVHQFDRHPVYYEQILKRYG
jgi:hypothetical protein